MRKPRVCLYTAHSPMSGGGGAVLRNLVENLPDLTITWFYTADQPAKGYEEGYLGPSLMGGPILSDILNTRKLLGLKNFSPLTTLVGKLLRVECDHYWIISHNEGLRVAWELATRQSKIPVHLTVHDDWAGALCARSYRYRFLASLAKELTITTLLKVHTFDVISSGMQAYYERLTGRLGTVCHRYLAWDNNDSSVFSYQTNESTIKVGHIGSVYSTDTLLQFIKLLEQYASSVNKSYSIHLWGSNSLSDLLPEKYTGYLFFHKDAPEAEIIPLLNQCDFVYAMYPLTSSLRIFSQTSLPTKLTSYIQARRPIFGHCPADSSLAEFIDNTNTGAVWPSNDTAAGIMALTSILSCKPNTATWKKARDRYFGETNLDVMRGFFSSPLD